MKFCLPSISKLPTSFSFKTCFTPHQPFLYSALNPLAKPSLWHASGTINQPFANLSEIKRYGQSLEYFVTPHIE